MTQEGPPPTSTDPPFREGETVLVRSREGESQLLRIVARPFLVEGVGVLDLSTAIGKREGDEVHLAGRSFQVYRPKLPDMVSQIRRRAQIITPKDAVQLVYLAGLAPGSLVLESGTGSGGLTLFLAHAVGPSGRVVSYDRRPEHQHVAKQNLERAGYLDRVTLRTKDVTEGFDETGADAVLLDLPEPWSVVDNAARALRPGGFLTSYSPTYNQLERTVRAMRERGFQELRAEEVLERGLHVGEGGTRPEFEMLGHTGFLTVGRWLPPPRSSP